MCFRKMFMKILRLYTLNSKLNSFSEKRPDGTEEPRSFPSGTGTKGGALTRSTSGDAWPDAKSMKDDGVAEALALRRLQQHKVSG